MKTFYPVSIVVHGVALNITVESYNGRLDFGLIACRRAAPDVKDIAKYLAEAHEELKAKAGALMQQAVPPEPVAVKKAPGKGDAAAPAKKTATKQPTVRKSPAKKVVRKSSASARPAKP